MRRVISRMGAVAAAVAVAVALLAPVTAAADPPGTGSSSATPTSGATGPSTPAASTTAPALPLDQAVHLNQIQVIGSHNSYHVEAPPAEEQLRAAFAPVDELGLE